MYFFRTFKKSTAQYKVHNMGLRYIKPFSQRLTIYDAVSTGLANEILTTFLLLKGV
jgi:hypothetical protein